MPDNFKRVAIKVMSWIFLTGFKPPNIINRSSKSRIGNPLKMRIQVNIAFPVTGLRGYTSKEL
jgi:hypothetical protein